MEKSNTTSTFLANSAMRRSRGSSHFTLCWLCPLFDSYQRCLFSSLRNPWSLPRHMKPPGAHRAGAHEASRCPWSRSPWSLSVPLCFFIRYVSFFHVFLCVSDKNTCHLPPPRHYVHLTFVLRHVVATHTSTTRSNAVEPKHRALTRAS